MAVRRRRRAGLRRAAHGRAGVVAGAAALYLAAGALALSPSLHDASSDFLAYGKARANAVSPGDHLQTTYNLWLPGHQLANARAPWVDPYLFQPEAEPRTNFAAWPFALVFWPLHALFGTFGAWNAFALLSYAGAGGAAALWLRSLGLSLGPALVGGLVFALAPYRSIQTSGGHLLGPVAMLLPLALYGVEARKTWVAVAALASIPLAGQVHLALGAIPFFAAYVLGRRGATDKRLLALAPVGAIAAGLLVWSESIRGTTGASGRSFAQVERYSAELLDFVTRHSRHGFETFVFLGWLVPLAAAVGLVLLWRRDLRLAGVLGAGVLVPIVLALGANTPLYEPLWDTVPGLGSTRVPGRLLPIACLCIAALAAFALARVPSRWAALAAIPLVALDLRVDVYRPLGADEHNAIYAQLDGRPGRLLERPVRLPDVLEGSVYVYYSMQSPRERPLGYSTTAPRAADRAARELRDGRGVDELGVRWIVEFERGRPQRLIALR